jgi:hypothetical protein
MHKTDQNTIITFQHPFRHLFHAPAGDGAPKAAPAVAPPATEPTRLTRDELRDLVMEVVG